MLPRRAGQVVCLLVVLVWPAVTAQSVDQVEGSGAVDNAGESRAGSVQDLVLDEDLMAAAAPSDQPKSQSGINTKQRMEDLANRQKQAKKTDDLVTEEQELQAQARPSSASGLIASKYLIP